jgi:hypothetical protein
VSDLFGPTHFQANFGLLNTQNIIITAFLIILTKVFMFWPGILSDINSCFYSCGKFSWEEVLLHKFVVGVVTPFRECTASSRPFLSKEASAAYATHRKRE